MVHMELTTAIRYARELAVEIGYSHFVVRSEGGYVAYNQVSQT